MCKWHKLLNGLEEYETRRSTIRVSKDVCRGTLVCRERISDAPQTFETNSTNILRINSSIATLTYSISYYTLYFVMKFRVMKLHFLEVYIFQCLYVRIGGDIMKIFLCLEINLILSEKKCSSGIKRR